MDILTLLMFCAAFSIPDPLPALKLQNPTLGDIEDYLTIKAAL